MNKKLMLLELKKLNFKMREQIKREIDENDKISSLMFLSIIEAHQESLESIIADDTIMSLKDEEKLMVYIEEFVQYNVNGQKYDKNNKN